MKAEEFEKVLKGLEDRKDRPYPPGEAEILFESYHWMEIQKFERLCAYATASAGVTLPTIEDFKKAYAANYDEFKRLRKAWVPCSNCKGSGARQWLRKQWNSAQYRMKYTTPVARCECDNGSNMTSWPSMARVEKSNQFVRWVEPNELPMDAVMKAEGKSPERKTRKTGEEG